MEVREHNDYGFTAEIAWGIHGECEGIQISDAYIWDYSPSYYDDACLPYDCWENATRVLYE